MAKAIPTLVRGDVVRFSQALIDLDLGYARDRHRTGTVRSITRDTPWEASRQGVDHYATFRWNGEMNRTQQSHWADHLEVVEA